MKLPTWIRTSLYGKLAKRVDYHPNVTYNIVFVHQKRATIMATDANNTTEMFGEKEVRWYQIAVRNGVADALERSIQRILIEQPTGSGKTLSIAFTLGDERIRTALNVDGDRPLRVLFAAHKHRLLTQAERTFADSLNVDIITQSIFSDITQDVIDAGWDLTVLDEAHHESCSSFQYHLERLGGAPIIGMTATSDRADGCLIKFEEIINPISREQAVAEKWLAETNLNTIVDTPSKDKTEVTQMIIDEFGHEFGQTMMFFRTKREVRTITQYLTDAGFKAIAVLDMSEKDLDATLDAFSAGKFQFILNCNKINEGVDVANCTDVYLGRQFGSYPQLNQVIGRAARPDSECNVWELINPLSSRNLDTTIVVGTPATHRLISKKRGKWIQQVFDYTTTKLSLWVDSIAKPV